MVMEDKESCASREAESSAGAKSRRLQKKVEVYNEVLRRLKEADHPESRDPGFDDQLWAHFNRLPTRYAIDVNSERADDVLTHKKLLHLARDPSNRPAFEVRLVQIVPVPDGNLEDLVHLKPPIWESIHPPPAFGSSPNLEAIALEAIKSEAQDEDSGVSAGTKLRPMHEITFSTADKPKLLNQLTSLLAEVGLNIQEAHVFSTVDGYSLDVFVVDGWPFEEVKQLQYAIEKEVLKTERNPSPNPYIFPSCNEQQIMIKCEPGHLTIPSDGTDVWEIDLQFLKFESKLASGAYGDLYKGTYFCQEVAIKILKAERLNTERQKEFAQEVYIMRKIRHKNVVQFIGACTRPPNLCIVTGNELFAPEQHSSQGLEDCKSFDGRKWNLSIYELRFLNEQSYNMDIIPEVVKVGDFGVARVKAETGVMTAETGTYRWMAPEVIEHKPYDHKADVFSFGVVLWELLTGKLPYDNLTPLQAAVGVVQKGLRPTIPTSAHPKLVELLERCWQQDPTLRPDFADITEILQRMSSKEVVGGDDGQGRKEKFGGIFSPALKRGGYH